MNFRARLPLLSLMVLIVGVAALTASSSRAPSATGPTTTFLGDIGWSTATNGWGPVEKNMSNGEKDAGDGRPITLEGAAFDRGLGVHAPADVQYALDDCSSFRASVGLDDEVGTSGSVVFQVYADANKVFDSGVMTGATATKAVDVSIAGASQLRLVVTNGGDNTDFDHADWADAQIGCGSADAGTPPSPAPAPAPQPSAPTPPVADTPAAASATSTTYLSDSTWTSASNGWGPIEKNSSNGEQAADDGRTLTLDGTTYPKGLGVHSRSEVAYSVSCSRFRASVGLDDEVGLSGSVVFQVYADANKVFDSGVMTGATATQAVDVSIAGVSQLRLVVTNGGDNAAFDHADWADAQVECAASGGGGAPVPPTPVTHPPVTPPPATSPPATNTTYLSDGTWNSASNGWGPVEKDKSNGEQAVGDGRPLTLNGTSYQKGFGVHGRSEIAYSVSCSRFKASVGLDDEVGLSGSVAFQVYADSSKVYDSGVMTGATATKAVDVSIVGSSALRLVVTNGGDNPHFDHADWAEPRVESCTSVSQPPTPAPVPAPAPVPPLVSSAQYGVNVSKWFDASHNPSRLTKVGAKLGRIEYEIGASASELAGFVDKLCAAGIKAQPQAGFEGRVPTTAEAQNLRSWALRFGPQGSGCISLIEFGNETSYSYQFPGDISGVARTYAQRAKEAAIALQGTGVGLLVQVDDALRGPAWVDNMYAAVPDLTNYVSGWTLHPYGPDWGAGKIDHAIADLARHGDTQKPFFFTEWGVASDNGRTLSDNYGWPTNMTYQQAADALVQSEAMWRQKLGSRWKQTILFTDWDRDSVPAGSTDREHYFGVLRRDGSDKGAYTAAVRQRLGG